MAAALSFVLPGLGQVYKGQILAGVVWFIFTILGYAFFIVPGLAIHLGCVIGASTGDPYKSSS